VRFDRSIQAYWHIHKFLNDDKVVEDYLSSHKPLKAIRITDDGILFEDGSVVPLSDDDDDWELLTAHTINLSPDEIKINLQVARQFYNRQMIVITATYIEIILKDFLRIVFAKFPERMHNYLDEENVKKGFVSLKLITKASSLSDLLSDLSEQAASNALKGRFKNQLNVLLNIIPEQEVSQHLQSRLIDIVEKRNRIVHEASQEQITEDNVRETLDTCLALLASLADVAVNCNISIDIPNDEDTPF
jgi:hypothetical protein